MTVEDAVLAVKRWFNSRKRRWLVVLDSADSIDDEQNKSYINLEDFLPDAPGMHVIKLCIERSWSRTHDRRNNLNECLLSGAWSLQDTSACLVLCLL